MRLLSGKKAHLSMMVHSKIVTHYSSAVNSLTADFYFLRKKVQNKETIAKIQPLEHPEQFTLLRPIGLDLKHNKQISEGRYAM